jgi:hypothetical protein
MAARANQTRRPSPAGFDPSFGKSSVEIAADFARGTKDGLVDLAADAARLDLLHVPRGLARLVRSAWESEGGLSGLASVVLGPGREQVATAVDRAGEGDFRGAAAAGVKAISVGVTTGIAIGELGAAAVNAVQTAGTGPGASGPKSGSAGGPGASKRFSEGVKDVAENNADGKCVFCGRETTRTPGPSQRNTDHAIPKARGGNNTPENAQNTCRTCNLNKGTKTTEEYTGGK